MQWKTLIAAGIVATIPLGAAAQPSQGDMLFTLSGAGSSDNDFDTNVFGLSFDVGQFMTDETAVGIRQSANIADVGDDGNWSGSTRVFADYHFDLNNWQPFVGGNIGGVYGDGIDETFFAGPEAGVKYYVKPEAYISFQSEYQVFFDNADEAESNFEDGAFVYSAGIGINF